ncbi:MAG TPA: hypothetical protein VNK46_01270 [Nitrospiraceae bacterium]|jgi:hypothetical protein|nr:hypothetical protein [Nitrospiraceae bacterium]
MRRLAGLIAMAAMLVFGLATTVTYAGNEPAPTEQQDKKDTSGSRLLADEEKDKDKGDKGGKLTDEKKDDKKDKGGH